MTILTLLGKAIIIGCLGYIAAPYGPFPVMKNVDFEPGVFVCTAAFGALVLALA